MKLNYVEKIKANLSIAASKKTTHLLDGLYLSVFKGQSLDFDDLRDYVIGDNSKDIDWKSSIRHGSLLVRRFVAFRRHNVLFLVDGGEKMTGLTTAEEQKSNVALYALGTLGYLASKNGDEIGAVYFKDGELASQNFKPGLVQLELLLAEIEKNIEKPNPKDINEMLENVIKNQNRKTIMVVISDLKGLNDLREDVLKKVAMNHDLLFIGITDADIAEADGKSRKHSFDIEDKTTVPKFIARNKKFAAQEREIKVKILNEKVAMLKKYRMSLVMIESRAKVPDRLIDLLERHNYAIRH